MKMNNTLKTAIIAVGVSLSGLAFADSIDPATYTNTLGVGQSVTITKTVTITQAAPTSAKLDVMFLMDTTGSMGSPISAAKNSATTILGNLASFGDLASGTAYFNDDSCSGGCSGGSLSTYTAITSALSTNDANTQAGINGYAAGYPGSGYDLPEEGYLGITNTVNATAWRPGSNRFIIMFGDASDGGDSPFAGDDFASASAALAAQNVTLIGVSYSSSFTNEYNLIANNSGGSMNAGSTNGATLANIITSSVSASFENYSSVCLDTSGAPAGVGVSSTPTCHTGTWDRSVERDFLFDVTFTGLVEGDYNFGIDALVDGGIVATELDHITVAVPAPGALGLLGLGLMGLALRRRAERS